MLVCMGVEGFLQPGHEWIFPNVFVEGAISGEIWFLPLETKITAFFVEILKFLPPPSDTHACVLEKNRATALKNWCHFNRFNIILCSEILLNLTCKMTYLTDQFQLFLVCTGDTK